jgi:hypothetical protein
MEIFRIKKCSKCEKGSNVKKCLKCEKSSKKENCSYFLKKSNYKNVQNFKMFRFQTMFIFEKLFKF